MKIKLKTNKEIGKLIVFEGTDGAGKTTMINMVIEYLTKIYGEDKVILEKQPTDLSRKTRLFQKMMYSSSHDEIDYRAVQLLTLSDRVQHNHEVIMPALKQGKIVVCDRYIYTSIANMIARNYTHEKWFFDVAKNIIKPDIAFLAYIKPQMAIKRILARPEECNRHLNKPLLTNVSKQFLKMKNNAKFHIINTDTKPEIAFEQVKAVLGEKLKIQGENNG